MAIEAIKISLAFKMARAADPSGRLSNQDVEAQYVRLGRPTFTKEATYTALPRLANVNPASGLGVRKEEVELRLQLLLR